ncbi:MAG: hypothetical protein COV10_00125 [Candidatus Vogelbacteria bacterium CG10_big_fil_rev_8_21_14_0_10_51_16]|uniref:Transglycosylase SLT domain-containing protein n=1 Tax=Candidatus Vogelbacteria bacterium CG10_big_fil_rev_8_21_14_0_10_51_16 TaxID=1975045 RepID=A0A2H0RFS7_9BACT|nr:MAG: hypothetical protein COV10_00125 [Candidatus Vogelbacteria bacterium CG10_big_fil_rev_8_21_14_0_10_51_16]
MLFSVGTTTPTLTHADIAAVVIPDKETKSQEVRALEEKKRKACADEAEKHSKECVTALIETYAHEFEVPKKLALDIAMCESSLRANVYGDNGRAFGTFQFHRPTFDEFAKKFGEELDYYDNEDSIKLAIWALANDKEHHWTCYRKVAMK